MCIRDSHIGFLLDCFHKTGVQFFLRCLGRMVDSPFFQQVVIIGQYAITPLPDVYKRQALIFGLVGGGVFTGVSYIGTRAISNSSTASAKMCIRDRS